MDEVNKYAHAGGDTAPGTREEIAARNKAADKLNAAITDANREAREATDASRGKIADAEREHAEVVGTIPGQPVGNQPASK